MQYSLLSKNRETTFMGPTVMFLSFLSLIIALLSVDVQCIGPQQSSIGLATINGYFKSLFGVNIEWYYLSEWLGFIAISVAAGFSLLGLKQLIKYRHIKFVDTDLRLLGMFYIVTGLLYAFFEIYIVNYRPIMLEATLEASFPSSHSMVVVCVMGTAMVQINLRVKKSRLKQILLSLSFSIIFLTIVARVFSGVHWLTDIIGGLLIGLTLTNLYHVIIKYGILKKKIGYWKIYR